MSDLEPRIDAMRVAYGLQREDFWQIKQNGQWVCKHAALEIVAVKAKIEWLAPQIIEHDANGLTTSMIVTGKMGDRLEWATGETNPTNYSIKGKQPAYPWAMSEKRAKDRVILKLVGIHGLVYSEDEISTGGGGSQVGDDNEGDEPMTNAAAKSYFPAIQSDLMATVTIKQIQNAWEKHRVMINSMPRAMQEELQRIYKELSDAINDAGGDIRQQGREAIESILRASVSMEDLKAKWSSAGDAMRRLAPADVTALSKVKDEIKALIERNGPLPDLDRLAQKDTPSKALLRDQLEGSLE